VQVVPFKNHGRDAGATLPHSHSQIVGLPFVSPVLRTQLDALQSHWQATGNSIFADEIEKELEAGERVVFRSEEVLAVCPYASAFPYEIAIYPLRPAPDFRSSSEGQLTSLSKAVKVVLLNWIDVLGPVPFNFVLHSAPSDTSFEQTRDRYPDLDSYYCWHMQLFPRLTRQAGFEWGTGTFINIVAPEETAAKMRAAEIAL
jgi:UDPglucose--hexose-1-phosphate uridylyltransferase